MGSNPTFPISNYIWGVSSAGRASRLHREGQGFDPLTLHHFEFYCESKESETYGKTRTFRAGTEGVSEIS